MSMYHTVSNNLEQVERVKKIIEVVKLSYKIEFSSEWLSWKGTKQRLDFFIEWKRHYLTLELKTQMKKPGTAIYDKFPSVLLDANILRSFNVDFWLVLNKPLLSRQGILATEAIESRGLKIVYEQDLFSALNLWKKETLI